MSERRLYVERARAGMWGHVPDPDKLKLLDRFVVGEQVLDIGCATGMYTHYLASQRKQVVGMDFVEEFLGASGGHHEAEWYVCGDALALPFAEKSFDTTVMFDVLEHVDDIALLREAARVTRQRLVGRVPLTEPKIMDLTGLIFYHSEDKTHLRTYRPEVIRERVEGLGLTVREIIPICPADVVGLFLRCTGLPLPRGIVRVTRSLLKAVGFKQLYTDCVFVAEWDCQ